LDASSSSKRRAALGNASYRVLNNVEGTGITLFEVQEKLRGRTAANMARLIAMQRPSTNLRDHWPLAAR
jgi:hypothetical protein